MFRKGFLAILAALLAVILTVSALAEGAPAGYREMLNGSADGEGEAEVQALQQRLIEIGYLIGKADGYFGAKTEEAIRLFQEMNGLEVTGIADLDTQVKLYSEQIAPAPTPAPTPRNLGAQGEDITAAQEKLAMWGFLDGSVDGTYGKATEEAVKAYKSYIYALEGPSGLIGTTPEPTPSPEPTPRPVLTPAPPFGASGLILSPVAQAEEVSPEEPVEAAEEPFEPDGEIDDALLARLRAGDFQVFREEMENGSTGLEVQRLQTRLSQMGYMVVGGKGVDGDFGPQTRNALRYFQKVNGLDITGIATEDVQTLLFSGDAKRSDRRIYPYKLIVDVSDQRVYVYRWDGEGYGDHYKTMVCSTGTRENPTILGTYSCAGRLGEWYYFKKYKCWARYAFCITGGYLFHSVTYDKKDGNVHGGAVSNLGRRASHGCVRLSVEDAKWLYTNCPNGTTAVIRE